jgi:sugar lactone lactonase YvrE
MKGEYAILEAISAPYPLQISVLTTGNAGLIIFPRITWGRNKMRLRARFVTLMVFLFGSFTFPGLSFAQNINTVVGGGPAGGKAKTAFIAYPGGAIRDKAGNTYINSNWDHYIFKLDTAGNLSVIAGLGYADFSGDEGPASSAGLNVPAGFAFDSGGNLYFADAGNNRVRRIDATTGIITTVAGSSTPNMFNTGGYNGDGIPATQAELNSPYTIAIDSQNNLFIADYLNFRIRRVDATTQIITTVAGTGTAGYNRDHIAATAAEIDLALGVIVDKAGNLYIADSGNNRIRRVDAKTQVITTVAGNGKGGFKGDGGLATKAELLFPNNVTEDAAGNLDIIDTGNNRVRQVNAKTHKINTIVGTGVAGFKGDGGPATKAEINSGELLHQQNGQIYDTTTYGSSQGNGAGAVWEYVP